MYNSLWWQNTRAVLECCQGKIGSYNHCSCILRNHGTTHNSYQLTEKWVTYLAPCVKGARDLSSFFLHLPPTSAHLCDDLWVLGAQVSFLPCKWECKVILQQVKVTWLWIRSSITALRDLGCSAKTDCCSKRQTEELQCTILEMFFRDAPLQVPTASCNMTKEFLAIALHIMRHQD